MTQPENLVPAAQGAADIGMTRERLVRAIQGRSVRGAFLDGKWYVERAEVERLTAAQHAHAA